MRSILLVPSTAGFKPQSRPPEIASPPRDACFSSRPLEISTLGEVGSAVYRTAGDGAQTASAFLGEVEHWGQS